MRGLLYILCIIGMSCTNGKDCSPKEPRHLLTIRSMNDKEQIEQLYHDMYVAMTRKDTATLNSLHAEDFVLTHMTGMRQSKKQYVAAIVNGTLNYYHAETEHLDIQVDGNHATMTGHSRVEAAVFGGGRHTWRLQLHFTLRKDSGCWQLTSAKASTY